MSVRTLHKHTDKLQDFTCVASSNTDLRSTEPAVCRHSAGRLNADDWVTDRLHPSFCEHSTRKEQRLHWPQRLRHRSGYLTVTPCTFPHNSSQITDWFLENPVRSVEGWKQKPAELVTTMLAELHSDRGKIFHFILRRWRTVTSASNVLINTGERHFIKRQSPVKQVTPQKLKNMPRLHDT